MKYNITGIGGDETCYLQVVADSACKNAEEIKILADENVFNAVKVRLVFVHCNKTCMCYIWGVCVVLIIFWPDRFALIKWAQHQPLSPWLRPQGRLAGAPSCLVMKRLRKQSTHLLQTSQLALVWDSSWVEASSQLRILKSTIDCWKFVDQIASYCSLALISGVKIIAYNSVHSPIQL